MYYVPKNSWMYYVPLLNTLNWHLYSWPTGKSLAQFCNTVLLLHTYGNLVHSKHSEKVIYKITATDEVYLDLACFYPLLYVNECC
jgi:hypothetical protein